MPASRDPPPPATLYQAYLLRLWRDGPGAPWRASLEAPNGEATFRFGTVGALFAFLRDLLADPAPAAPRAPPAAGGAPPAPDPENSGGPTPRRPGGDRP